MNFQEIKGKLNKSLYIGKNMRIELYYTNDEQGKRFKDFLIKNNLQFKEMLVNNEEIKREIRKLSLQDKASILKVVLNQGIHVYSFFDEENLNLNLIGHIKKYKPRI